MNPERGVGRLRRPERRFLLPAARVVLVSSVILGTAALSVYYWDTYFKEDGYGLQYGREVENRTNILKVTDPDDVSNPWIAVRKKLSRDEGDIVGWVKPGHRITTTEVRGPNYPSGQPGLGWYEYEGKVYGKWFLTTDRMPAYGKRKDGTYVPMYGDDGKQLVVSGFIQGNDLRPPNEQELQKSTPAR